jgi:uncharacterized membrane protein
VTVIFGTTFIGFFGNKFIIGRLIVDGVDYVLEHIPGIKFIYTSLKDVLGSFVGDKKNSIFRFGSRLMKRQRFGV